MNEHVKERGGLAIVFDLLSLTREMAEKRDDTDFLIESIDARERLMNEYDHLKTANAYAQKALEKDKPQITGMIHEIIELDKTIDASLRAHHEKAKEDLKDSNSLKKVLNYTNNAVSASGSYMDFKK